MSKKSPRQKSLPEISTNPRRSIVAGSSRANLSGPTDELREISPRRQSVSNRAMLSVPLEDIADIAHRRRSGSSRVILAVPIDDEGVPKKYDFNAFMGFSELDLTKAKGDLFWRALVGEFLGTLLLVFVGCGSIVSLSLLDHVPVVQISLVFGVTVASIVQIISHLSGGHINPAVSLSFFVTGDIKLIRAGFYILVQCIGAITGAGILRFIIPSDYVGNLGATYVSDVTGVLQGLIVEVILTFLLVLVIHSVCDSKRRDNKGSGPIAIGLAVSACHFCGIHLTGSSLNPARSLGPAVVQNSWEDHWIYWAGPILGGIAAGLVYKYIFKSRKSESDSYDL